MVTEYIWHVIQLGKIKRRCDPCVRMTQISHPVSVSGHFVSILRYQSTLGRSSLSSVTTRWEHEFLGKTDQVLFILLIQQLAHTWHSRTWWQFCWMNQKFSYSLCTLKMTFVTVPSLSHFLLIESERSMCFCGWQQLTWSNSWGKTSLLLCLWGQNGSDSYRGSIQGGLRLTLRHHLIHPQRAVWCH